ncbi:ABC transporter substrate-binding protein [Methanothrix sp.]|uniref:ABC transporter substrate-binding protein n=1 Tax=Methanothrix sp. TaxID=90426 RepID=UPI003BB77AE0
MKSLKKFASIIIALSIVVVVIGVSNAVKNDSNEYNKGVDSYPTGRLWVLGNANNDDFINQNDVDYINKVISEGTINNREHIMCDANYDGNINSDDIKQVQGLIDGTANKMWYVNVDKKICSFNSTLDKNILTIHPSPTEEIILLNPELIVASDDYVTQTGYTQFRDIIPRNFPTVGDMFDPDIEAIVEIYDKYGSLIVVLGTADYFAPTLESQVESFDIQVVRLPSWESGIVAPGILTLGYLLGETESAYKYLKWHDRIINKIKEKVSSIPDEDKVKLIMINTAPEDVDEIHGPGFGDYENSIICGGYNLAYIFGNEDEKWYATGYTLEDIISLHQKNDLEMLISIFVGPFYAENGKAKEYYNTCVDKFQPGMEDIKICVYGWDISVGPSYPIAMILYANWMYPSLFEGEFVILDEYQYYLSDIMGYSSWNATEMEIFHSYLDE